MFIGQDDLSVLEQDMIGWREHTRSLFETVEFAKGSHFYITEASHKDLFYAKLSEECLNAVTQNPIV